MSQTLPSISLRDYISSAAEIIEEARAGRMFILVDDEDRENEGDLVIPAQFATPDVINFMVRYARGLVCLALTRVRVGQLGLSLMSQNNESRHQTAFTVSIEAREGVSTGISAADRARTIAAAINPECGPNDIVTPGHVFPLAAQDGGTLVRAGHTEAAVDVARLAGLYPAGVICEIMNEDGSMARLPDLVAFAQHHNLKLGTIADLIAYRRRTEKLVACVQEGEIDTAVGGHWRVKVYANLLTHEEHVVLIKGIVAGPDPVLVRMHAADMIRDLLLLENRSDVLRKAMHHIARVGRGVVVLLRNSMPGGLAEMVRNFNTPSQGQTWLRDYGIGAQILLDLGVKNLILLTNRRHNIVALEGYGLNVVVEEAPGEQDEATT